MSDTGAHIVVGLMSGTSLDGVDVAITRMAGSGQSVEIETLAFATTPYSDSLRADLLSASTTNASDVALVGRLNAELARVYADVVRQVCRDSGVDLADVHAIGSHGQTVHHDPSAGYTLQIGDPSLLAHHLKTTVVGDFRQGDIALGGEGAPLVPYMDWCVFGSDSEDRVLLNLGGIANITSLPAGCARDQVVAFDTGPANMVVDALAERLLGRVYDEGGTAALRGDVNEAVVDRLMQHPYFDRKPPKSTGRELFDTSYVDDFLSVMRDEAGPGGSDNDSIMATAAELSVRSICDAIDRLLSATPQRLIVAGGGIHNRYIMQRLEACLEGAVVETTAAHGIDPDAKEAICFAILAHEALAGVATGMPTVTGASGRAFLGKICYSGN